MLKSLDNLRHYFISKLLDVGFQENEAQICFFALCEKHFQLTKIYYFKNPKSPIPENFQVFIQDLNLLSEGIPLQYILGETNFFGLQIMVNNNVLIPRPETEELIEKLFDFTCLINPKFVLDLGCGSGAIALAIQHSLKNASVFGIDISSEAIHLARQNAINLNLPVNFIEADFTKNLPNSCPTAFDLIISNPPYIPDNEIHSIDNSVIFFEPHLALFSPKNDPIYYYKHIANLALDLLKPSGEVWLELYPPTAQMVSNYFIALGFSFTYYQDISSKTRFLKATKIHE